MFQIKKIIKLKNVERQQQKRPNSYESNGFSTLSIYGFLLFFVLTKHGTNQRGRLASSAMWIIMALCIQSQDDILLQVINRNKTRLPKTRIVIPLVFPVTKGVKIWPPLTKHCFTWFYVGAIKRDVVNLDNR